MPERVPTGMPQGQLLLFLLSLALSSPRISSRSSLSLTPSAPRALAPWGISRPADRPMLRLRGGKRQLTNQEKLERWRKKYPLGMALYDACGGVVTDKEDEWYDEPDIPFIQSLLDRGADVNFSGPGRYTPLHFAASRGFNDVVRLLVERSANLNASSEWFWTPLHCAAASGETEMVKLLVSLGADLYARTAHDHLPLDEATGREYWETASALKRLMGPDWYKHARKSYHMDPTGCYVYDPIEMVSDDHIAMMWQKHIKRRQGVGMLDEMFENLNLDSNYTVKIDPSLRDVVGWIDDDGCYHAPWECEETWQAPSISDSLESSEPQVQEEEERDSKRRRKGGEKGRDDTDDGERDDD